MIKDNFKEWAVAAGIRAIKTVAQSAIAAIGTTAAMGDVNWVMVGSTALLSGVISILTSITGLPEVKLKTEINSTESDTAEPEKEEVKTEE